ncbi:hypothetical protein QUF75_01970 [Desulfococcaceae bacterium HSG7]|nr:hypothetical protein [Desulfococcaceae bacterium HSG7]
MKIALFGGSFDPVGQHHLEIVKMLLNTDFFDQVVVVPCGPRPDKKSVNDINPVYRATMLDITFRGISEKIKIDLHDLEKDRFSTTFELEQRYASQGEVWHVVGFDLVEGGRKNASPIQKEWANGRLLWEKSRFIVILRDGTLFSRADLPPTSQTFGPEITGASSIIRNLVFNHQPIDNLVTPEVARYIERYSLYRGRLPLQKTLLRIDTPRLLVAADENNASARDIKAQLWPFIDATNPNLIVDIGGDGNKLHAIRKYWRLRLPFLGINAGHRGYLLNDVDAATLFPLRDALVIHYLPLLHVGIKTADGNWKTVFGFNEAWIERATGQSAWIELIRNNRDHIPKVVGDGLLISTAAGSTGYAKNIAGFSLPTHVRELLLVGMGIAEPSQWRNTIVSPHSVFEFKALNTAKRPVRAYVDGVPQGRIEYMRIRTSRIAAVELAFIKGYDIAEKHTGIQLPYFEPI